MKLFRVVPLLFLLAVPVSAQEEPTLADEADLLEADASEVDSEDDAPEILATRLVIENQQLDDLWLEVSPLTGETPARRFQIEPFEPGTPSFELDTGLPGGPAMLCTTGDRLGLLCERIVLDRAPTLDFVGPATLDVLFDLGTPVTGTVVLGTNAVEGAEIAVVPAGLQAERPFVLPLDLGQKKPPIPKPGPTGANPAPGTERRVPTDEAGQFTTPPIAEGDYFLEVHLPSGRIFRTTTFTLPDPPRVRLEAAASDEDRIFWDLGLIDVTDGLLLSLQVLDTTDEPLPNVLVSGRQGSRSEDLQSYQLRTNPEGRATLGGLRVEEPLFLTFDGTGYRLIRQRFDLAPAVLTVRLEPLASVRGEVLTVFGEVLPNAKVQVEPLEVFDGPISFPPPSEDLEAERTPPTVTASPSATDGSFRVAGIVAGRYRVTAAGPGHEVREVEVTLDPGENLDLGPLLLSPGSLFEGRVVDAKTGEGIPGAELRALRPAGAFLEITDVEGAFELSTDGQRIIEYQVTAETYAAKTVQLNPAQQEDPIEIELVPGGNLLCIVYDAAGRPCRGCRLVIQPGNIELTTNAAGKAASPSLTPGLYTIYRPRITHLGSRVIEQTDARLRRARVEAGEITEVTFRDDGGIAQTVRFAPRPGPRYRLRARGLRGEEIANPNPDGSFPLGSPPNEPVTLYLHYYDPDSNHETWTFQGAFPPLSPGDPPVRTLPLHPGELRARVLIDGRPAVGARIRLVSLVGEAIAEARTDAEGHFRIRHTVPGVYNLMIGERPVRFVSVLAREVVDVGVFELFGGSF